MASTVPAAIGVLQKEHVVIGRVLSVMEDQVSAIDEGILPRADLIDLIAGFFSTFADRRHHGKDERYLFPPAIWPLQGTSGGQWRFMQACCASTSPKKKRSSSS